MKLSVVSILTLGLTAGALAAPANMERDLPTITGVLSGIGPKVAPSTPQSRHTRAATGGDALGLPGPVNDLKQKITTAVTHLSGKKSQIVQAGKGGQTYNDLIQQKTAAKKLSDAIVSKVPQNLQNLASGIAGGISDAIEKGVQDFQDQAGKDGKRDVEDTEAVAAVEV
ncbi:hypothetical protein AARAC_008401 [Aspergillus arachidicola]|uniref:Cell wall mannoprotein 1 n=1 Tax=Aspergillus arachidicola TaxID=656916 RepID=A0A2G7GAC0_9EURO|nr:hypothetical protein AARAC_008401 [Aspergillus arachidicola]